MKCPKCNAEIEEGTVYCPFCAAKVSSDVGRSTTENERMPFDVKDNAKGRAAAEDSGNELGKRVIGLIGGFDSKKNRDNWPGGRHHCWRLLCLESIREWALITRNHSNPSACDV